MGVQILFVDDDEMNLVVWQAACSQDFDVLFAQNAERALELMRTHEVGVLLADQRMPGASGVDLLERVRTEFPDTIRILITAYSDLQAAVDAINRGQVRRYLRKPCRYEEMKTELVDALDLYHMKLKVRTMENRLVQTERVYSLGLIVAGVGHEIRNPIGVVNQNLNFARDTLPLLRDALGRPDNETIIRERLHEIDEALGDGLLAAQQVADIVRGIELSSRPTADTELVDVAEVVRLTLRLARGELRDVALEVSAREMPRVRGSAAKLGQVTLNLLTNAIHAAASSSHEPRSVRLATHSSDETVHIEICDTGDGIPPADLDRIFDPFFTTNPGSGTGLGLAISRRIIEEMGGVIEVRNRAEVGALFHVALPVATN